MATIAPLRVNPVHWEGLGPPNRALQISCQVLNPNAIDLFISSAWLEVRMANGPRLCEGPFFHAKYPMAFPAIIRAHEVAPAGGEILIPLSPTVVWTIEENRKGGDLNLQIDARVLTCGVFQAQGGGLVIHTPRETQFCSSGYGSSIHTAIAQSEWVRLLKRMQWSEVDLVESPAEFLRTEPLLAGARVRLEEAQTNLWSGDWEGAIQSCRKAWEAAARALTGTQSNAEAMKALGSRLHQEPKTAALNEVALALAAFVHLARHDQPTGTKFTRNDALLTFNLTAILLTYLANSHSTG